VSRCGLRPCGFAFGERVLRRDRDRTAAVGVEQRRRRLATKGFDARDLSIVERRHLRLARQCGFDKGRQLTALFRFAHRATRLELGHDAFGKHLERLADMFVAVGAALLDEHDLVDAGFLVARQMRAQLIRGADAAAPSICRAIGL